MRKVATILVVLVFASIVAAQEQDGKDVDPSRVTLPLAEYERLRAPDRGENVTVVDAIRLSGSFRDRNLSATFVGKSVGTRAGIAVLQSSGGLTIWGCSGSAVISRGDGVFRLNPLAGSFTTTCRIAAAGSDRVELIATRDVLAIESAVGDGELVAGEKSADGTSRYSLVRQSAGGAENLPPTATGHYLITLLPDETRFRYAIDVHNPNRSRRAFEVRLRSNEHLQQVDAVAPYEIVDGAYRFDLPPGDTTLVLTGQLSGDSFTPPVEATLQYLAIENHPILRPTIEGPVKRVSAAEAGVPIQFRGPQAFLVGAGETMRWRKTKLEAMHTTSYALNGARHTLFVPAEGGILGESVFAVDNQGASDLQLPVRPEPTYLSVGGEPLMMTKGADGKLNVPLSAGRQDILIQHRQPLHRFAGFAAGRIEIPQVKVPASSLFVQMNYPRQWWPLFESFSTRSKFWRPSDGMLLTFFALLLWSERVLAYLRLPVRRRLLLGAAVAAAAASFDAIALVAVIADSLLTIAWLVPHLQKERWTFLKSIAATVVVAAIVVVLIGTIQTRKRMEYTYSGGGGIASLATGVPINSEQKEYLQQRGMLSAPPPSPPKVARADLSYQGLPARFDMPGGERHSYFGQEMLPADSEHAIVVLLISSTVVWFIGLLLVAVAGVGFWRSRDQIAEGIRQRFGNVNQAQPTAAVTKT